MHKLVTTLQHYTKLYKQKSKELDTTLQNCTQLEYTFTHDTTVCTTLPTLKKTFYKFYTTLHKSTCVQKFTKLFNTIQNATQLYTVLQKKLYTTFFLQLSTNLYTNCTKSLQHVSFLNNLYKTLHNFIKLYTTLHN